MTIIFMNWLWCIRCNHHWEQPSKEMPQCPKCGDKRNAVAYGGILVSDEEQS